MARRRTARRRSIRRGRSTTRVVERLLGVGMADWDGGRRKSVLGRVDWSCWLAAVGLLFVTVVSVVVQFPLMGIITAIIAVLLIAFDSWVNRPGGIRGNRDRADTGWSDVRDSRIDSRVDSRVDSRQRPPMRQQPQRQPRQQAPNYAARQQPRQAQPTRAATPRPPAAQPTRQAQAPRPAQSPRPPAGQPVRQPQPGQPTRVNQAQPQRQQPYRPQAAQQPQPARGGEPDYRART
jgi:FtsZ-interacting cell division protein ZipA